MYFLKGNTLKSEKYVDESNTVKVKLCNCLLFVDIPKDLCNFIFLYLKDCLTKVGLHA